MRLPVQTAVCPLRAEGHAPLAGTTGDAAAWLTKKSFWMMLSTSVVLGAAMLGTGSFQWPNSMTGVAGIAGVCVFYAIGLIGLFTSATRIGPIRTSAMMNLEPVIAIALSTVVLHQGLSGLQYAGGVLVMVGVVGAQLSRMPTPAAGRGAEKA